MSDICIFLSNKLFHNVKLHISLPGNFTSASVSSDPRPRGQQSGARPRGQQSDPRPRGQQLGARPRGQQSGARPISPTKAAQ